MTCVYSCLSTMHEMLWEQRTALPECLRHQWNSNTNIFMSPSPLGQQLPVQWAQNRSTIFLSIPITEGPMVCTEAVTIYIERKSIKNSQELP